MRILIAGNGGREHALLWKLRRDAPPGSEFFATYPNGGMVGSCIPVLISPDDVVAISEWAASHRIDLVVIGPEGPLAAGLADSLAASGLAAFGPSRAAARIESSKAFSKNLMRSAGVPTAEHRCFTEPTEAEAYIRERGAPIVVKASGLAGGKGAIVCWTVEEALTAARMMLSDLTFGEAGSEVVIEEFMEGEELSILALTDGSNCLILPPAQDHKRVGEGDSGPNTGGMGAYSPVSVATPDIVDEARKRVFEPTLLALSEEGFPFRGLLYAGLMLTPHGIRVVEFNCRFGDPETQAVLPLMASSLLDPMMAVAEGRTIADGLAPMRDGACVTTVVATEGYPGSVVTGAEITIPDEPDRNTILFHAGTRMSGGRLFTSGGRVLAVSALAPSFPEAADASVEAADRIRFEGAFHRSDIGWRERARSLNQYPA